MAKEGQADAPLHILVSLQLKERVEVMARAREQSVAAETRLALQDRLEDFESRQPSSSSKAAV